MVERFILRDFLMASPYSKSTDFGGALSKDRFYQEFFIKPSTYKKLNKRFESCFEDTSMYNSTSIFLYGYSGMGKTTYINWYSNQLFSRFNTVIFDLADYICEKENTQENETQAECCIKLFDIYFSKLVGRIFENFPTQFNSLLSTLHELRFRVIHDFSREFMKEFTNYYNNIISNNNHVTHIEISAFEDLVFSGNYQDLLMLALYFYHYYPNEFGTLFETTIDKERPLLIIYDNIDHVAIESNNSKFPKIIETIYNNVRNVIRDQKNIRGSETIHSIFCLRDANCSIINRQAAENIPRNKIEFIPFKEEDDIYSKRITMALDNEVKLDLNKKLFLSHILADKYTKRNFLPLFNFNLRKFALFLERLVQEEHTKYIGHILDLSENENTKYGARGIEYYMIISYLWKNDYLKERLHIKNASYKVNEGYLNPARIILTNILNHSEYTLDVDKRFSNSKPVGLYDLFLSFNQLYPERVDSFFEILTNLFLFHKENWCHLITFDNKQVLSEDSFSYEKRLIQNILENPSKENNFNKIEELNRRKIRLNPAGFMYIRDITRHYEFFSIRAGNKKPLFCSLNCEVATNGAVNFDFIWNIKRTFNVTKGCIENLIEFLDSDVFENFADSEHCFKTYSPYDEVEDSPNIKVHSKLHTIRIIDTHIRYLDTFRRFILDNNNSLDLPNQIDIEEIKKDINKEIVGIIEQYVSFLIRIKHKGEDTQNLIDVFQKNIDIIKKSGYENKISVNNGRN